jgi:hypothetical protein
MALWILNRPAEAASPAELRVAELLSGLADDWVVRWGFHYEDDARVLREGDFLVLGPHGGLMVVEVKGGSLDHFVRTGRWDTSGGDHPLMQLDAEWKAVVNTVNAHARGSLRLFVAKALAVPQLDLAPGLSHYHDIPRYLLLTARDLRQFPATWADRFARQGIRVDSRSRETFFDTYGRGTTPLAVRHFVDEADLALLRQTEGNYELLDVLGENRQFLVRGGTGTGKTWLAFELACRWAEKSGGRVLFLGYNLALVDMLQDLARRAKRRGRPSRGEVVVESWEGLAKSMVTSAGLPYEVPTGHAETVQFFSQVLPELMAQIVRENLAGGEYDALVVDEAQDHDTQLDRLPADWTGPGWWGVYWRLLKEETRAPVALFYDTSQRPTFRTAGGFDAEAVYAALRANPVKIRLARTVRYSRPILRFLHGLDTDALKPLVGALHQCGSLPEGPEVEKHAASGEEVAGKVASILRRWFEQGYCRPEEVLLLSFHGRRERTALAGVSELADCPLVDFLQRRRGCLSFTSVNKAKGLDALGVIMIDFPSFDSIREEGLQVGYFMGASRARQLLAIVEST